MSRARRGVQALTDHTPSLSDKVYIELVRSLYANVTPATIMTGAFALCFLLIELREGDGLVMAAGIAGVAASIARLAVTRTLRRRALTAPLNRNQASRLEVAFAVPYLTFASCLGAFGAYVFSLPSPEGHMITICLLVGYCAGVATGAGLRPLIAVPSMMLAIVPAAIFALSRTDPIYLGMAIIALAFLAAGSQTVLARAATVKAEIGKRLTFGSLARSDGLTALPNRLALREYFDENAALIAPQALIAVHYLDLDGFKPVNDQYGHRVGDALLAAVAERLTGAIRNGDIVARLGGDEFAIVQFSLRRPEEAELLAQRIVSAIGQTFSLGSTSIRISASIGSVTTPDGRLSLDELLAEADTKLYAAKRARGGEAKAA